MSPFKRVKKEWKCKLILLNIFQTQMQKYCSSLSRDHTNINEKSHHVRLPSAEVDKCFDPCFIKFSTGNDLFTTVVLRVRVGLVLPAGFTSLLCDIVDFRCISLCLWRTQTFWCADPQEEKKSTFHITFFNKTFNNSDFVEFFYLMNVYNIICSRWDHGSTLESTHLITRTGNNKEN